MPSTRTLSITALIISLTALTLAVADFSISNVDSTSNAAAIFLPAHTLAQTLDDSGSHDPQTTKEYWLSIPEYSTYWHPQTGLTFDYPSDFRLSVGEDSGGTIILGENSEQGMAFQIFIQPFDEPGPLTFERIHRDLPELALNPGTPSWVTGTNTRLLRFTTPDEILGPIPEAWFIHDGYLYQVAMTAPGDPEQLLYPWFNGFLQYLTFTQ